MENMSQASINSEKLYICTSKHRTVFLPYRHQLKRYMMPNCYFKISTAIFTNKIISCKGRNALEQIACLIILNHLYYFLFPSIYIFHEQTYSGDSDYCECYHWYGKWRSLIWHTRVPHNQCQTSRQSMVTSTCYIKENFISKWKHFHIYWSQEINR